MSTPAISYTNLDFESLMTRIQMLVAEKYGDSWTDFYESNLGMALIELAAYQFDILAYYIQVAANEQFLPTARDRESIILHGKHVGYRLRPPTSASVACTATIDAAQVHDVVVDAGTTIASAGGVTFELLTEQRIAAGATTGTLTFTEGETQTETFTATGVAFQAVTLAEAGVIDGSVEVAVDGVVWDYVTSHVYSDADDQNYTVDYDVNDYATITFGDGTNGAIPATGVTISVEYRIGGGVIGNVAIGQIDTSVDGLLEGVVPASLITVTLANEERGTGGEERETIEHARFWIPRWVAANGRAVTENDFDVLANAFSDPTYGAAAFVKARLKQQIPELNTVVLSVWARDYAGSITTPTSGLKLALYNYFMNNGTGAVRLICTDVEVEDGLIVYSDVVGTLNIESDYASSTVISAVQDSIRDLFEEPTTRPGADIYLSDLYAAIDGTTGVRNAILDYVTATYQTTEIVGTADGLTGDFAGTLDLEPGLPVVESSVYFTLGSQTIYDDGDGNLIGDVDATGTNTILYETGAFDLTFAAVGDAGDQVQCQYRYILDYDRNEAVATATGTTARIVGSLTYPPVVPYQPVEGQKGISFSDGSQVVTDDGSGNLTGDVDASGSNTIDYDTGKFDFTFALMPANGASIYAAYMQLLKTPSENIPIDKSQIAVPGNLTFTATVQVD